MTDELLFGRVADVTIGPLNLPGFDCRFKIEKSLKPQPNTCRLDVFNLNEDHRSQLEELRPKTSPGSKLAVRGIPVKIEAGYGKTLSLLWLGDLRTVNSIRQGSDWVTTLESGDAEKAYVNARVNVSYGPKTPVDTALTAIVRALGVGDGNIAATVAKLKLGGKVFPHGTVISGSAARELTDFCSSADLEWSIQDGAVQIVDRGKALASTAIKLSDSTGMIGSPTVDSDGLLTVKFQIIHDVRPGRLLVIDAERVKGAYRIEKATWSGDTAQGDWNVVAVCRRY